MSDHASLNSAENAYTPKAEGHVGLRRALMISFYVFFCAGGLLLCALSGFIAVFAICPLLVYIVYLFTWRLVSYDVYWEFTGGTLTVGHISLHAHGVRQKHPRVTFPARQILSVTPYTGKEKIAADRVHNFAFSRRSPYARCILFREGGRTEAVVIDTSDKLLALLTRFAPESVKN